MRFLSQVIKGGKGMGKDPFPTSEWDQCHSEPEVGILRRWEAALGISARALSAVTIRNSNRKAPSDNFEGWGCGGHLGKQEKLSNAASFLKLEIQESARTRLYGEPHTHLERSSQGSSMPCRELKLRGRNSGLPPGSTAHCSAPTGGWVVTAMVFIINACSWFQEGPAKQQHREITTLSSPEVNVKIKAQVLVTTTLHRLSCHWPQINDFNFSMIQSSHPWGESCTGQRIPRLDKWRSK